MFAPSFKVGGYAVSHQGFLKIVKRTDATIVVDYVDTEVTPSQPGSPSVCTPGASQGYEQKRTKVLSDQTSEYLQWGRARHDPKWRPWDGKPILYRVMNADEWPRDDA